MRNKAWHTFLERMEIAKAELIPYKNEKCFFDRHTTNPEVF